MPMGEGGCGRDGARLRASAHAALTNGPALAALMPVSRGGPAIALPLAAWVHLAPPLRVAPPA